MLTMSLDCFPHCFEYAETYDSHEELNEHWKTQHGNKAPKKPFTAENAPIGTGGLKKSLVIEQSPTSECIENTSRSEARSKGNKTAKRIRRMSDRPKSEDDYRESDSDVEVLDTDSEQPSRRTGPGTQSVPPHGRQTKLSRNTSQQSQQPDGGQKIKLNCILCHEVFSSNSTRHRHMAKCHPCLESGQLHQFSRTDLIAKVNPVRCHRCEKVLRREYLPLKSGTNKRKRAVSEEPNQREQEEAKAESRTQATENARHTGEVECSSNNAKIAEPQSSSVEDRRDILPANTQRNPVSKILAPPLDYDHLAGIVRSTPRYSA